MLCDKVEPSLAVGERRVLVLRDNDGPDRATERAYVIPDIGLSRKAIEYDEVCCFVASYSVRVPFYE